MKKHTGICYLLFAIFICSCGNKRIPDSCTGAMCTADFKMLTVFLKDSNGAAYMPDKVETYSIDMQLINTQSGPTIPGESMYTYIDDSNLNDLGVNTPNEVIFKVIKSNTTVKQDTFTVKADCCHVIKVSAADTLIVQ